MINKESQIRLSVSLAGRSVVTTTVTKKHGKKIKELVEQELPCTQSLLISSEAVAYFISDEGKVARVSPSDWKKKKKEQRVEAHLQIIADTISGRDKTKFTYQVIN